MKPATALTAILLLLVAAAHLLRLVFGLDVTIENTVVPAWASLLALMVPVLLAVGLWREHRVSPPAEQPAAAAGRKLTDQEKWNQLSNALSMCTSEDQVIWSIFGTFWAANAILLVALFSTGKLPEGPLVGPVVAAVGFALSLVWHTIQNRALGHLQRFEELVYRIEDDLNLEPQFSLSARRNLRDYDRFLKKGPRARGLMRWCSAGAAALWAAALIIFVAT